LTKAELRKLFAAKRKQLSVAEYNNFNQQLLQQFQQIDLTGIGCIHLYLPIRQRNEPDTFLIRDWLEAHHPQINRVFPKANFSTYTIENYLDDDQLQLAINPFGIPEPVAGNIVSAPLIDLMLVPLLAFDTRGYRVGYGKGFYDRLMAQCRPGTQFIGLSFFGPVDKIDDFNEFDRRLTRCITPRPPEGGVFETLTH